MELKIEKFKSLSRPMTDEERAKIAYRRENAEWLRKSATIALKIRKILRLKNLSQARFAELMGVSSPQVSKLLSGKINFELKTICKIERILGEEILSCTPVMEEDEEMEECLV